MNNAHVESLQLLAKQFREDTSQPLAPGPGPRWASITAEIREHILVMPCHRPTHQQKFEWCVLARVVVMAHSRLQTAVGRCHQQLKFSTNSTMQYRATKVRSSRDLLIRIDEIL